MTDISFNFVLLIAVVASALCVIYGIRAASSGARRDAEIKHQEFEDSREEKHRETLASIAAERDAKIAEFTKQSPKAAAKQIEG
jgi:hypothetical protein